MLLLLFCLPMLTFEALSTDAQELEYKSAYLDNAQQLHLVFNAGIETLAPKEKDQVGFADPAISPDHKVIGWLELYPFPDPENVGHEYPPIAEALTLYRNGNILKRFSVDQTFWGWQFWHDETEVAYAIGPTHGGARECLLREVNSGKILAQWIPKEGATPPDWAKALHTGFE